MEVCPVSCKNSILINIKVKFLYNRASYLDDLVLKSSIKTIISRRNGIRMIDTSMADNEDMYSVIAS